MVFFKRGKYIFSDFYFYLLSTPTYSCALRFTHSLVQMYLRNTWLENITCSIGSGLGKYLKAFSNLFLLRCVFKHAFKYCPNWGCSYESWPVVSRNVLRWPYSRPVFCAVYSCTSTETGQRLIYDFKLQFIPYSSHSASGIRDPAMNLGWRIWCRWHWVT